MIKATKKHLKPGVNVVDSDGNVGVILKVVNTHNIYVEYIVGGSGVYCLDKNCEGYDPLYLYFPTLN